MVESLNDTLIDSEIWFSYSWSNFIILSPQKCYWHAECKDCFILDLPFNDGLAQDVLHNIQFTCNILRTVRNVSSQYAYKS